MTEALFAGNVEPMLKAFAISVALVALVPSLDCVAQQSALLTGSSAAACASTINFGPGQDYFQPRDYVASALNGAIFVHSSVSGNEASLWTTTNFGPGSSPAVDAFDDLAVVAYVRQGVPRVRVSLDAGSTWLSEEAIPIPGYINPQDIRVRQTVSRIHIAWTAENSANGRIEVQADSRQNGPVASYLGVAAVSGASDVARGSLQMDAALAGDQIVAWRSSLGTLELNWADAGTWRASGPLVVASNLMSASTPSVPALSVARYSEKAAVAWHYRNLVAGVYGVSAAVVNFSSLTATATVVSGPTTMTSAAGHQKNPDLTVSDVLFVSVPVVHVAWVDDSRSPRDDVYYASFPLDGSQATFQNVNRINSSATASAVHQNLSKRVRVVGTSGLGPRSTLGIAWAERDISAGITYVRHDHARLSQGPAGIQLSLNDSELELNQDPTTSPIVLDVSSSWNNTLVLSSVGALAGSIHASTPYGHVHYAQGSLAPSYSGAAVPSLAMDGHPVANSQLALSVRPALPSQSAQSYVVAFGFSKAASPTGQFSASCPDIHVDVTMGVWWTLPLFPPIAYRLPAGLVGLRCYAQAILFDPAASMCPELMGASSNAVEFILR